MSGGWWDRASLEQKLRQVDAGIELGMTSRQIALASGVSWVNLARLAAYHGRKFVGSGRRVHPNSRTAAKRSRVAAYFRGEAVDLWREYAQDRNNNRHGSDEAEELILE